MIKIQNEDGSSVVEFAITLPILMLLFFGVIHIGIYIYDLNVATTAASTTLDTRIGLLNSGLSISEANNSAVSRGEDILNMGIFLSNREIDVDFDEDDQEIKVTISARYTANFPLITEEMKKLKNIERTLEFIY